MKIKLIYIFKDLNENQLSDKEARNALLKMRNFLRIQCAIRRQDFKNN